MNVDKYFTKFSICTLYKLAASRNGRKLSQTNKSNLWGLTLNYKVRD